MNGFCKGTEASVTLSELCVPQRNSVAGIKGLHEGPAGTQGEEATRDQIKRPCTCIKFPSGRPPYDLQKLSLQNPSPISKPLLEGYP